MQIDYRLPLMAGVKAPIPELQLVVHSPTVEEIAFMGEQKFFSTVQYLCLEKEQLIQDENILSSFSNFQVMMKVIDQSKDKSKKQSVITLLQLLFPDYVVAMTKNSIIFTKQGEKNPILVDDNNFNILQEVLREVLCVNSLFQGENIVYNTKSARAKEIEAKIMRGRRRVAEIKSKESKGESALIRYMSILSVARVASLEESSKYNLFQLFDQMERYIGYVEWDTDQRVKLAGGKTEKQVENWMKDLHPKK